jgi:cation diffusion facilitator family transporter
MSSGLSLLPQTSEEADREKRAVAFSSVVAGLFLTGMKLAIGLMTGSLGILSEAAHSALDFMAAGVTWFAVRVSGRPADREHTYGHGKVENLSALFETALLFATCVWISVEAVKRLFFEPVHVEATVWAFAVMAASIIVDVSRSRALRRAAVKHRSQALEADAFHFSTDVWSSAVVIVGLAGVFVAERTGRAWLAEADAVAALGVSLLVARVSVHLGKRAVAQLLDAVPTGLRDQVERAVRLPGVVDVTRVRVRRSGPEAFADLTLRVAGDTSLESAHEVASNAEAAVRRLLPGADVVVHVEPAEADAEGPSPITPEAVRAIAERLALHVHDINVVQVLGSRSVELHLEVPDSLNVADAHAQATAFEQALWENLPGLGAVVTHIEPAGPGVVTDHADPEEMDLVLDVLHEIAHDETLRCDPHNVTVRREGDELGVSLHCGVDPNTAITAAHALTERVERGLRARLPSLGRIVIHVEPLEKK